MKKYTGAIILGFLAIISGTDCVLATGSHATISEWLYHFIQNPAGLTVFTLSVIGFWLHIYFFHLEKKS